jgi:hypothetical protein
MGDFRKGLRRAREQGEVLPESSYARARERRGDFL